MMMRKLKVLVLKVGVILFPLPMDTLPAEVILNIVACGYHSVM